MKNLFHFIALFLVTTSLVNAQDWIDYKSEDLAFIAEFPGEPERTVQEVETAIGIIDMHMIMHSADSSDDNMVYSIIRSDYPEEEFKDADDEYNNSVLDGAVNGATTNVNGELTSDEKITHNGFPGRSIKIKISGAFIYMNAYLVNNTMFVVQVICLTDKDENEDIKRFMDSFDMLKVKED